MWMHYQGRCGLTHLRSGNAGYWRPLAVSLAAIGERVASAGAVLFIFAGLKRLSVHSG
jgi:hypothetical protein